MSPKLLHQPWQLLAHLGSREERSLPHHAVSTCDGDSPGGNNLWELNADSDTPVPSVVHSQPWWEQPHGEVASNHPLKCSVNPCCYFPCQHQGVCVRVGLGGYECDCTRTGYFGTNCTSPELWTRLHDWLKPSPAFYHFILTHFKWFWDIVNSTFIRDTLMRLILTVRANLIPSPPTFNSDYGYISWEAYANVSYYTRVLPPVPDNCPTPMGTKGETIKIVIEDYVQHLSGYYLSLKFDPELLFGTQFQYRNRIAVEFNQLYHWHGLMPDSFVIQGEEYSYEQFLYNTSMLIDYGVEALVESFSKQVAGRIGGTQTINANVLQVAIGVIKESRQLRLQPFNEYRKRFGMKPYKSFQELTGEEEKAAELEELYGDIDALEFYPGLLLEKPQPNGIFGESMVEIGAPFSLKGLFGNPICSPEYWKPSTFGGETGFEIVKTASLEKLVCLNVKKHQLLLCPSHEAMGNEENQGREFWSRALPQKLGPGST
ncbi:prostaglandin g h synthase 1 [Limosa lapponica baueri]|uniref:Prostaglandin G/H synthase 1 n=1 Tax=Limosa lapponica baueri TaxID=1758121 RepID=A0A2I0TT44_LIMLA|nr:prostaglandin g h synthase 1 [Limosa lapponica baueri]